MHVQSIVLADPPGAGRREEMREISRVLQQVERQSPHNITSDKELSALFYSFLHADITSLLHASSLDWFVASPSAPGSQSQYALGRGVGPNDGSGEGGSTTRRSEGGSGDNAPAWLTMDGQVCRYVLLIPHSIFVTFWPGASRSPPIMQLLSRYYRRNCVLISRLQVLRLVSRLSRRARIQALSAAAREPACVCHPSSYNGFSLMFYADI